MPIPPSRPTAAPASTTSSSSTTTDSALRSGLLLGALIAPTALGTSAPAVSLPRLAEQLALTGPQTAWVLAAYALTLAIGFVLSGRLAEQQGLRRTLVGGAIAVGLGSLLAAGAFSFGTLVAGRLLQGLGGAAISIGALGSINAVVPAANRPKVLAVMTAVIAAVSGSGALIGGVLTDSVGWRAVVALPLLALLCVPASARMAPSTRGAGSFDATGAALLTAAAGGLVVLLQARSTGLSGAVTVAVAVLTLAAAAGTAVHLRRHPDGFLPREAVTNTAFLRLSGVGIAVFGAYLATVLLVPVSISAREGWSPVQIGAVLLPGALAGVGASMLAGAALRRGRGRLATIACPLVATAGMLLAALWPSTTTEVVAVVAVVSGYAAGQVVLLDLVPQVVAIPLIASAVSLFNFLFFFGGALGSASAGALLGSVSVRTALGLLAVLPLAGALLAGLTRGPAPTAVGAGS